MAKGRILYRLLFAGSVLNTGATYGSDRMGKFDNMALVRMIHNRNTMDLAFSEEMLRIFDEVLADESVKSMAIASSDAKFFSMGVDVD